MSTTPAATATLEQAREHARAQSGTKARTKPTIPASTAAGVSDGSGGPDGIRAETIRWDETIGTGNYASKLLRRGTMVRFTDTDGDACVAMVVFNAEATQERINVADTVKVQWQAYLGAGALLLSDMGRVLMTIVDDSSERHDALCGYTNRRENERRYGAGGVSSATPAARELLALAAAKHGLARRDLPSGVNLFKGVRVGADGSLALDASPQPGASIVLRAEMDVIVLVANTPHPLDVRADYAGSIVRATAWHPADPWSDPDPQRTATPERTRAFERTDDYLLGGS